MFDVGFWEIAIIALIALIILGPERLPRAARTIGLWVGKARRTLSEVKRDIDRELDASELKNIKNIKDDLQDTKNIFEDAASTLNETASTLNETATTLNETASTLNEKVLDEYETIAVKPEIIKPEPVAKEQEEPAVSESKTAT